ncbi:SprT family zinc-dependent metalloprotease [Thalassobaculum sp. OXR-137]|uniref:M48 family metallopeptidase n=1 Tax=Thalassobaculum sp. OXR-137 TaxID=3100173 RepID=UPI002AC912A5|nr:SprT family zinc-dependent metalloprotease [Thalassobaculum sp. OXR-137]WPZ35736.1 SprT family zinc-dependent metalloprotease [Thalassobaculum sp. OXR-137]
MTRLAPLEQDILVLTDTDGTEIPVPVRRSARARRMLLRVDPVRGGPELVLPAGAKIDAARTFATKNLGWLRARLAHLPARTAFVSGATVPILGRPHLIRHRPDQRGGVWRVEDPDGSVELHVSGTAEHLPRRLTDFLKGEARRTVGPRAKLHAEALGRKVGRVTVRDTATRWGSCSSRGDLSFSWRLVLAPEEVLDYVVAHEAAHLVEMNHSDRFWALVELLMPDYKRPRTWLKRHGSKLHAYG